MKKVRKKSNLINFGILIILCVIGIFLFLVILKPNPEEPIYNPESFVRPVEKENLITHNSIKLDLTSAYGDNEGYHPKVISFDKPWNGYHYWIAFTPYPSADQGKENPHILASNDLIDWEEPIGYDNPLEPQPDEDSVNYYNSDTHIVFNEKKNRLECFWRFVNNKNMRVIIYRKYTYDGVHWSEKEAFLEANRRKIDYLSPVVMIEDNKYKVWYIDRDFSLKYTEKYLDDEKWLSLKEIEVDYGTKRLRNWHLDVIKTSKGYEVLMSAFETNRNKMKLYYLRSVDNVNYTKPRVVLEPFIYSWNNKGLYRSSLLYYKNTYIVFYSGIGHDENRGVGIAYGKSIDHLIWLTENNLYDFKKLTSKRACYQ